MGAKQVDNRDNGHTAKSYGNPLGIECEACGGAPWCLSPGSATSTATCGRSRTGRSSARRAARATCPFGCSQSASRRTVGPSRRGRVSRRRCRSPSARARSPDLVERLCDAVEHLTAAPCRGRGSTRRCAGRCNAAFHWRRAARLLCCALFPVPRAPPPRLSALWRYRAQGTAPGASYRWGLFFDRQRLFDKMVQIVTSSIAPEFEFVLVVRAYGLDPRQTSTSRRYSRRAIRRPGRPAPLPGSSSASTSAWRRITRRWSWAGRGRRCRWP